MIFRRYNSFNAHLYRNHESNLLKRDENSSRTILCCVVTDCNFKTNKKNEIVQHSYIHIKNEEASKCPLYSECKKNDLFTNINTSVHMLHGSIIRTLKSRTLAQK